MIAETEQVPPSPSPRRNSSSSLLRACEDMDTSPYVSPKKTVSGAPPKSGGSKSATTSSKNKVMTSSLSRASSNGQLKDGKASRTTPKKKTNYVVNSGKPPKKAETSLNSIPNLMAEDSNDEAANDSNGEKKNLVRTSKNSHHYEHVAPVKQSSKHKVTSSVVIGGGGSGDAQQSSMELDEADPTPAVTTAPRSYSSSKYKGKNGNQHHYEIRSNSQRNYSMSDEDQQEMVIEDVDSIVERMEGVEDHSFKPPLIVLDGANVAYAYATTMSGVANNDPTGKPQPDPVGIQIACNYFIQAGLRVLVVLPAPWIQAKPRSNDDDQSNAKMVTPQLEVLSDLKAKGLLVASPPRDDDDAYAITIARREDRRRQGQQQQTSTPEEEQLQQFTGGYVLSNDNFRDAMSRDSTNQLKDWLTTGEGSTKGPGRISFAFCDMGGMDDHGDHVLDVVPNPRHQLISWIESRR